MSNINTLVAALTDIFKRRPVADWLECLERAGVPAGPVLDIAGMQADPQALARGMITEAPHTRVGPVKTLGHPVHYSATPAEITRGAPLLGEHTREVLAEHGYSLAEVDKLISEGAAVAENS
jgi:crotonobetainyl-CoA:carnitine CoA-transferase CaiB-like acyl-CoA transferase